jgi:hypothetical protein
MCAEKSMKSTLAMATLLLAFNVADATAVETQPASGGSAEVAKTLLMHHLASFKDNDLDAVVSDYTDESVLITADTIYTGRQAIRGFFAGMIPQFPKQKTRFDLDKMIVNEGLALIVWHATTPTLNVPLGTDSFLLKDGKILQQTFVGQMQRRSDGP